MKYINKNKHHWFRRFLHLCLGLAPIIYYWLIQPLAIRYGLSPFKLLLAIALVMVLVEAERLYSGRLYFAQREYERSSLSAGFWTGIGLILVFMFAPEYNNHKAAFGLPIIWCLTLGDPLLGECRLAQLSKTTSILITLIPLTLVWLIACLWFSIPFWLLFVLPGLAILAEYSSLRWIDDNFMMLTIPLLFIKFFF